MAEAEKNASGKDELDGWFGAYLNPQIVNETRKELVELLGLDDDSDNIPRDRYAVRAEASRFLREFDNSIDNGYGDAVFVVTSNSLYQKSAKLK